jgi:hypothetical protein
MVFYWSLPGGVPAPRIANVQPQIETCSHKIDEIRVFFVFLCEKVIETRRFSHLQSCGCDGVRSGARGSGELKSFVDQQLGAPMFHVKQNMNKNPGLSSR